MGEGGVRSDFRWIRGPVLVTNRGAAAHTKSKTKNKIDKYFEQKKSAPRTRQLPVRREDSFARRKPAPLPTHILPPPRTCLSACLSVLRRGFSPLRTLGFVGHDSRFGRQASRRQPSALHRLSSCTSGNGTGTLVRSGPAGGFRSARTGRARTGGRELRGTATCLCR